MRLFKWQRKLRDMQALVATAKAFRMEGNRPSIKSGLARDPVRRKKMEGLSWSFRGMHHRPGKVSYV